MFVFFLFLFRNDFHLVVLHLNLSSLLKVKLIVKMKYDLVVDSYEFHQFDHYLHHDHFVRFFNEGKFRKREEGLK